MKIFKICLKLIFFLFFISAGLLYIFFHYTPVTSLQFQNSTITIVRDEFNIPFIKAPNKKSLYYAWGYVVAEDRLFQFTFKQLVAHGRLSQYLGQKTLSIDRQMRELNFRGWGQRAARKNFKEDIVFYRQMEAFSNGINDYVASLPTLPLDFHFAGIKWENSTVQDLYTLTKLVQWTLCVSSIEEYVISTFLKHYTQEEISSFFINQKKLWKGSKDPKTVVENSEIPQYIKSDVINRSGRYSIQFQPQQVQDMIQLGVLQYFSSGGSNAWVISGKHTESGLPFLANDPHLQNTIPSQWYQIRYQYINKGKKFHFRGTSLPGLPIAFGKSNYLTTGVTVSAIDTIDFYMQTIGGDKKYLINGEWRPLKERKEVIKVKKNGQIEEQVYSVYETFRGPLINYISYSNNVYEIKENISLVWTGFHEEFQCLKMAFAISEVESFQQLVYQSTKRSQYLPHLNLVYITKDNHIGFQQMGRSPLRRNISSGQFVKDGSTTQHDWIGFLAAEDRINLQDPERGFIVIANNKLTEDDYMNGYHHYMIYTARADRIHQNIENQIKEGKKFTIEDMKKMQLDTVDIYCQTNLPIILQTITEAKDLLGTFDCNFTTDSYQATIYEVFFYQLQKIISPRNDQNFSLITFSSYYQYLYTYLHLAQKSEDKRKILSLAWQKTKNNLTEFYQSSNPQTWVWSKYHKDAMKHYPFSASPLSGLYGREFGGWGNFNTPNVGRMSKLALAHFQSSHRAGYRSVSGYQQGADWWILDSGSNERFFSVHYDDQWQLFQKGEYIKVSQEFVQNSQDL